MQYRKSVSITKYADSGSLSTGLTWMQLKMRQNDVHVYYLGSKGKPFGAMARSKATVPLQGYKYFWKS